MQSHTTIYVLILVLVPSLLIGQEPMEIDEKYRLQLSSAIESFIKLSPSVAASPTL